MKTVTLDTGALIVVIDRKPGVDDVLKMFEWHRDGKIELHVSNRVFEHDTTKMQASQVEELRNLLETHNIATEGAAFRLDFSLLSGGDHLSGRSTERSPEDMAQFTQLVGSDPIDQYRESRTISNKIGDYDSLKEHYASGRDVFVTLDRKHYLDVHRRNNYEKKLGLVIMSPSEFVK